MRFLNDCPLFLFFTGKGGVGKTSLACATAVWLADHGQRVLLVSTDPASNVGQVFGQTIGGHITPILDGLQALEIDPLVAAQVYRERVVGPVRGVLPDAVVRGIEEQLSGACTTEIAAFDEFTDLLTDDELPKRFDHILFDTAPTGHTIRLLQLPGAWSGFLDANPDGASCLGPLAGLEKQRHRYRAALEVLGDERRSRMVLVTRPQNAALGEVTRTAQELQAIGIQTRFLVINGCMPVGQEGDPLARAIRQREQEALATATLSMAERDQLPLRPFNLVGIPALRAFFPGGEGEGPADSALEPEEGIAFPVMASLMEPLAAPGRGLILLMGKGGVGKTTLAVAIAVALSRSGHAVHLSTSDPASHLEQTLGQYGGQMTMSRIDPRVETERYRQEILTGKGASLDAQGRAMLEEDLRSPCTEEIAVFQAFSKLVDLASTQFVVMDTAPTGHTLLLLDATGAYHREVERHQSQAEEGVTTPMMRLRDPDWTRVLVVTLPETTPVLEAVALQEELRRAGIHPWAWLVNQSLAVSAPTSPLLQQRARRELPQLELIRDRYATRMAVLPLLPGEPVGQLLLQELVTAR